MTKESTLIIVGILLLVVPFIGLPPLVRTILIVASGLTVLVIGVSLKAHLRAAKKDADASYDQEILGGE